MLRAGEAPSDTGAGITPFSDGTLVGVLPAGTPFPGSHPCGTCARCSRWARSHSSCTARRRTASGFGACPASGPCAFQPMARM